MNKELLEKHGYNVSKIINDSLFGFPTELKNVGNIYPIKVKEFGEFNEEFANFILINHDYLNIPKSESLISALVVTSAYQIELKKMQEDLTEGGKYASRLILDPLKKLEMMEQENNEETSLKDNKNVKITEKTLIEVMLKFAKMLSFLMKEKVEVSNKIIGFEIWNKDKTSCAIIQEEDFLILREIVLLQNGLVEPVKYHDSLLEEWMNKAKDARRNKNITFNDIVVIVKNSTNQSYKDVGNMNMLQFYSDYHWINHANDYHASILFKTVSNKVPNISFADGIISKLFKNNDDSLFIDLEKITGKLG